MLARKGGLGEAVAFWVHPSLLLALWLAVGPSLASSPFGKQCPTAETQTVEVTLYSDCGHAVGKTVRAPIPGEEEFVQCHCADKHKDSAGASSLVSVAILPAIALITIPALDLRPSETESNPAWFGTVTRPPPSPPPSVD